MVYFVLGSVCSDRYVILGGHRDAWVFGGIDPVSGAAVVHESVRAAGKLMKKGVCRLDSCVTVPLCF